MTTTPAQLADSLRTCLALPADESLYGIVDAARDGELAFEAQILHHQEIRMLFEGDVAVALADVAPYIVPVDPAGGYLEYWARRWGKSAGVLLTTGTDVETLYRHLRTIFIADDEEGQEYFFRFYDPRVLRDYLPTCTTEETNTFFGPISSFLAEGEEPETLQRFTPGSQGTTATLWRLSGVEPAALNDV